MSTPPPPPPQQPRQTGLIVGLTFAGLFGYVVVNVVVGFIAVATGSSVGVGIAAAFLAVFAFGLGLTLVFMRKPWSQGLGMGLMIGWALVSIVSAGFCTGLNPGLYV